MSLPEKVYRELAAVVGEKYISDKEFILAGNRAKTPDTPIPYRSPEAILLPGSAEEVAEIVKICNRNGLDFVPSVSGAIALAYCMKPGCVLIDLKRIDRILELNEEDRYVVIEPGVRHVQLYPELRKRGLTYPAAAVGPGGSVLANISSFGGDNHTMYGSSRPNRHLLGVEIVTREGEILRTGSLQTGAGWFCSESPGPSLRGLIKGWAGNHGDLGIVTKCAIALDPCKGPAEYRTEGVSPHNRVYFDSDCSRVYVFNFERIQDVGNAIRALGECEVGSTVLKYFYLPMALMMTSSANEFFEKWNGGLKEISMPLVIHLAPRSVREREYEEKIVFEVMEQTHGKRIPREIETWWEENMDFFMIVSRLQSVLRLGGQWAPIKLGADSVQHMCDVGDAVGEFIYDFTETGKIFDAPQDYQVIPMEYGHFAMIELLFMWDRLDPDSGRYSMEFMRASQETDLKHHYHSATAQGFDQRAEAMGRLYSDCHLWMRKIKESFDPYYKPVVFDPGAFRPAPKQGENQQRSV
jgi:glycolate oxidase